MTNTLFSPYKLGPVELANRVVMSPMTRNRAIGNLPNDLVATYYGQRAEAGLVVTEGTAPAPEALGYARIPGLFNDDQALAWRKVTDTVHRAGSRIFVQLMHTGRVSHPDNMPSGTRILAPSAVALPGTMFVDDKGLLPAPLPQAMTEEDIDETAQKYANSAALALEAGFDGVELHGANGYLIEQFLNTATNQRTDRWGGSLENRMRFAVEVAKRTAARIGRERVGMRLSPYNAFNGMKPDDEGVEELHAGLAHELSQLGLVYLHLIDQPQSATPAQNLSIKQKVRKAFRGTLILSGGYDRERAEADLAADSGDLIAFGRPFLANPRLVTRLREGKPIAPPDFTTLYTAGEKGYTDYPVEA